MFLGD